MFTWNPSHTLTQSSPGETKLHCHIMMHVIPSSVNWSSFQSQRKMFTKEDLHDIAVHIASVSSCDLIPKWDAPFYTFNIFSSAECIMAQSLRLAVKLSIPLQGSIFVHFVLICSSQKQSKSSFHVPVAEACRNMHAFVNGELLLQLRRQQLLHFFS